MIRVDIHYKCDFCGYTEASGGDFEVRVPGPVTAPPHPHFTNLGDKEICDMCKHVAEEAMRKSREG